jgi:uncharacterized protein (TIGR03437 family)
MDAARAQTTQPISQLPGIFLNGAGFFATGGTNYGAFSPCSIGTLAISSGTLDPGAVALQPSLYGAPIQYEYPYGYALYFNQEGASPNANTEGAPILSITGLINQTLVTFQVPCDITPGAVPVTLMDIGCCGILTTVFYYTATLNIHSASPGIFETPMGDGARRAVAVRPDGTFVSLQTPAHRGEIITLFITGLGPTSPPLATGARPPRGIDCVSTAAYVAMVLGDSFHGVPVLSAHASPSLIGVDELDFQVPDDAPTGNDVFIEVGVLVTNPGDYQFANPGVGSKIPIQ